MASRAPAADDPSQGDEMELKKNLADRIAALSEALKASQELMAPQLDAGTKGHMIKNTTKRPARRRHLPHH